MLPTPATMLAADCADLTLWCRACQHQVVADLAALVRDGRGDVPLVRLRWRCGACGSRRVESVVSGRKTWMGTRTTKTPARANPSRREGE